MEVSIPTESREVVIGRSTLWKRSLRMAAATVLLLILVPLAAVAGLVLFEYNARRTDPKAGDLWWTYPDKPTLISSEPFMILDANANVYAVHRNVQWDGPAPWEAQGRVPLDTVYRLSNNQFGFFTRYPVDNYPPKRPNQYRIIVTGGSGAQGHGATSWDRLFYVILEKRLNEVLSRDGIEIEVINLAQAGAFAARNAVVLGRFGHDLQPDLILLYNGANDIAQFTQYPFWQSGCTQYISTHFLSTYEYPDALRPWARRFPYLFNVYGWGTWLKSRYYEEYYWKKALAQCYADNGYKPATDGSFDPSTTYDQVSYPSFMRAVRHIKRDFCGIPIVWGLQAIHSGEKALYEKWIRPGIYHEFFNNASAALKGYYNDEWYFVDVDTLARKVDTTHVPRFIDTSLAVHLDDAGHQVVGGLLAESLAPIIRGVRERGTGGERCR